MARIAAVDAKHGGHHFFDPIAATVRLDDGGEGAGQPHTGGQGGHAIASLIKHDLAPFLISPVAGAAKAHSFPVDQYMTRPLVV